ncbi:MAG: TetR/AcrR family transcriptional regulator [Pseudomonadota bacterium]
MARTQAADYDKKRDAITVTAAKLFARHGFSSASMAEIAGRCDVSKSLIYHYYPSKEAILFDVMSTHIDALLEAAAETSVETAATPSDKLIALSISLLRRYIGAANAQRVLLYELSSLPKAERDEIIEKQRRLVGIVEEILAEVQPALSGDRGLKRARAMLYFSMLNWSHSWFNSRGAISRDELAIMIAETSLRSL